MKSQPDSERVSPASFAEHRKRSAKLPLRTSDFDYPLPDELIAQRPLDRREASRLLVSPRAESGPEPNIIDCDFEHVAAALAALRQEAAQDFDPEKEPLVILNDSKVYPARIPVLRPYHVETKAERVEPSVEERGEGNPGEIQGVSGEVFLLSYAEQALTNAGEMLQVLLRPQKKFRPGESLWVRLGPTLQPVFEVVERGEESCFVKNLLPLQNVLVSAGQMPLPPYIKRPTSTGSAEPDPLAQLDKERYQTIYARELGSAAAPTAGLHFSQALLRELEETHAARFAHITLHVGLGTFRPVQSEDYSCYDMHAETYSVSRKTLDTMFEALESGRALVFVGTTSFRAVESFFREVLRSCGEAPTVADVKERAYARADQLQSTQLFVHPGLSEDGSGLYRPCQGHAMFTNFHQPRSTLLMLVASLVGFKRMWAIYDHALHTGYRFLSYGDGSLLRFARRGRLHELWAGSSARGDR